jgi:hypothetical protein
MDRESIEQQVYIQNIKTLQINSDVNKASAKNLVAATWTTCLIQESRGWFLDHLSTPRISWLVPGPFVYSKNLVAGSWTSCLHIRCNTWHETAEQDCVRCLTTR